MELAADEPTSSKLERSRPGTRNIRELMQAFIPGLLQEFMQGLIQGFIQGFMQEFIQEFTHGFIQEFIQGFIQGFSSRLRGAGAYPGGLE